MPIMLPLPLPRCAATALPLPPRYFRARRAAFLNPLSTLRHE